MAAGKVKTKNSPNIEPFAIFGVVMFSIVLVGGTYLKNQPGSPAVSPVNESTLCCDSGTGAACKPLANKALTFNDKQNQPVQYGLLKSQITMNDCAKHLRDTGQTFEGHPIIMDTSDQAAGGRNECGGPGTDMLADARSGRTICVPIPDDQLVYVCTKNCGPAVDTQCDKAAKDYYGTGATVYDVYFRLNDYPNPGVPDVIQNCKGAWLPEWNKQNPGNAQGLSPVPTALQNTVPITPYPMHHTEQLHTFQFNYSPGTNPQQWIRPWCKPAIYLYPEQAEQVHVSLDTPYKILKTIPQYPTTGWDVMAYPNGSIETNNTSYDYLFYEASIPDALLQKNLNRHEGYVVAYQDLSGFFSKNLTLMGLNDHEKEGFTEYWLKALPKAAYYYIGVLPQSFINTISPLRITPQPDSINRLNLSFEPLNAPISVIAPQISPFIRHGFTVVEWGGMLKQDKDHPFTCLM